MATGKLMVSLAVVFLMKVSSTAAVACGGVTCTDTQGDCVNDVCYCKPLFMGPDCNTGCAVCTSPLTDVCNTATTCAACDPACDGTGGSCATVDTTPTCKCNSGYYGNDCAQQYCTPDPCKNSGTCSTTDGTCACTGGWTGPTCEECPDGCTDLQQCTADSGTPSCECKTGLSGTDCTKITCNADGKAPCENEGTCADAACTCTKNFAGTICELECTPVCGENEQCEVVDSSPQCNHGVTAMVTPALITSLLIMLVFL